MSKRMSNERAKEVLTKEREMTEEKIEYYRQRGEDIPTAKELAQALYIAVDTMQLQDKLLNAFENLEQNKWHTTTPSTDGIYFVFYHREKNVRILGEYKNNEWYDRKGNKLDKYRVISWKLVEPYVRSEDNE